MSEFLLVLFLAGIQGMFKSTSTASVEEWEEGLPGVLPEVSDLYQSITVF
jgi:hypothetical protein